MGNSVMNAHVNQLNQLLESQKVLENDGTIYNEAENRAQAETILKLQKHMDAELEASSTHSS